MADSKLNSRIEKLLNEDEELICSSRISKSKTILFHGGLFLAGSVGTFFAIQFNLITIMKGAIGEILLVCLCIMGIKHSLTAGACVTSKRVFEYTNNRILRSFKLNEISNMAIDRVDKNGVGTISFCMAQEQPSASAGTKPTMISIFEVEEAQQVHERLSNHLRLTGK